MTCPVGNDLELAAKILRSGGLVAFPTETVYGLGANAMDVEAVAKVFEAKQRPTFDPLIVHVPEIAQAKQLAKSWPATASQLANKFWPGPLTLVVPRIDSIPDLVTSGLDSVALRVPSHPIAQQLLAMTKCPIAAPSANPFGRISPTTSQHVVEQLGDRIDYVVDGGPTTIGIESTVVSLLEDTVTVLRFGGITLEQLQATVGTVEIQSTSADEERPTAPGQLLKHYAPLCPIDIVSTIDDYQFDGEQRIGLLSPGPVENISFNIQQFAALEILSPTADLTECAAGFFAALRRLDAAGLDRIVAIRFLQSGLGRALNDRLNRAAA